MPSGSGLEYSGSGAGGPVPLPAFRVTSWPAASASLMIAPLSRPIMMWMSPGCTSVTCMVMTEASRLTTIAAMAPASMQLRYLVLKKQPPRSVRHHLPAISSGLTSGLHAYVGSSVPSLAMATLPSMSGDTVSTETMLLMPSDTSCGAPEPTWMLSCDGHGASALQLHVQ